MPRGEKSSEGTEKVSKNGYTYVKLPNGRWRLKHHIIAEAILGRSLREGERVYFRDMNRKNFRKTNIVVRKQGETQRG